MPQWSDRTRVQAVQFEWEAEPQLRAVRLVGTAAQVGDPVRVAVAGVEVEGRIDAVESSTLHVRIGQRLFYVQDIAGLRKWAAMVRELLAQARGV